MTRRVVVSVLFVLLAVSLPLGVVVAGGTAAPPGSAAGTTASDRSSPDLPDSSRPNPADRSSGSPLERSSGTLLERSSPSTIEATSDADTIHRRMVLRHLPDRPGEFEAEVTFELPDRVTQFRTTLGERATVRSTDGFERDGERAFAWTESTRSPSIRFVVEANETDTGRRPPSADGGSRHGIPGNPSLERQILEHPPFESPGLDTPTDDSSAETVDRPRTAGESTADRYFFVTTGEWGVVRVPDLALAWSRTGGPVATDRTVEVDGPGATGGEIAYFGEVREVRERTAEGERFRLVVPEAAAMEESPADVLDSLESASESLRIRARSEEVFVLVAPTGAVEWAARGIQYGADDAWVVDDARLDVPSNVWLHEYVHTRQSFARTNDGTAPETRWLTEGTAEYYAALLALEQGRIEYGEFRTFLERGASGPHGAVTLSDPSTWESTRSAYVKGPLVAGEVDRRIRLGSDGESTLQSVLGELNVRNGTITQSALLEFVDGFGGPDARDAAARYTETDDAPATWDRTDHRAAFDRPTAAFEYALAEAEGIDVAGRYRNRSGADIPTLVVGETLSVPIAVANVGDRDGPYRAVLRVGGRTVAGGEGRLAAGERRVERLAWTPSEAGRYEVGVGDRTISVRVRQPAALSVSSFAVDPDTVEPGAEVTAAATVENDADVPGEKTVRVRTPDGVAHEERVVLEPGGTATVAAALSFEDPGEYEVAVDDEIRTVTVERADEDDDPISEPDSVPGFGTVPALVALFVALLVGRATLAGRR